MSDSPYDPEQNYSQFRQKHFSDGVSFDEWLEFGKKQHWFKWRIPISMFQTINNPVGDLEEEEKQRIQVIFSSWDPKEEKK